VVGLVLVSHSAAIAEGLATMCRQVAGPDVAVVAAGGVPDGGLGTSADRIEAALRTALAGGDGVLVLLDLGSAVLSLEVALESLDGTQRGRVQVSDAPLVEGAVLAAVQASLGAPLDEVLAAAHRAVGLAKRPAAAP
jgi:dihydroxyacetone kinase phosphotransfer subunit